MKPRIPDWQLPQGVDRGLWDYLHSEEMVQGYDAMMQASPLAALDIAFCERAFPEPGDLLDLGCGTARLAIHMAQKGYRCTGVDLSSVMLQQAKSNAITAGVSLELIEASLLDLKPIPDSSFDYAACLFSTLGMIRGSDNRLSALRSMARILRPKGRLVLHLHRRWFRGLGWPILWQQCWRTLLGATNAGDVTMPQHYAGAPLTLHHFTWREVTSLLKNCGFKLLEYEQIVEPRGVYGYLILAEKAAH